MPPFNGRQIQQQLRAFLVFIQLQIIMYFLFLRLPYHHHQPDRDLEEGTTCGSGHGYYRERRGGPTNIMADLYATDIPGFTKYTRMTSEIFEMINTRLEPHIARQATNYRALISIGEK